MVTTTATVIDSIGFLGLYEDGHMVGQWSFTEFSETKNICHNSKRTRTYHLLCKRPGCYHSARKTHVRDRIIKLSPINSSVIHQIPRIR